MFDSDHSIPSYSFSAVIRLSKLTERAVSCGHVASFAKFCVNKPVDLANTTSRTRVCFSQGERKELCLCLQRHGGGVVPCATYPAREPRLCPHPDAAPDHNTSLHIRVQHSHQQTTTRSVGCFSTLARENSCESGPAGSRNRLHHA